MSNPFARRHALKWAASLAVAWTAGCQQSAGPASAKATAVSADYRPKWEYTCVDPKAEEPADKKRNVLDGFAEIFDRRGEQGWMFLGYAEGGFAVFYGRPADPALRRKYEFKVVPQEAMLEAVAERMGKDARETPENLAKRQTILAEELARQSEGGWRCVSLQGPLALFMREK